MALVCQSLMRGSSYGSEVVLRTGVLLVVFAFLAITSWQFLRRYPTVGVLFSACLTLSAPIARNVDLGSDEVLVEAVFGLSSAVGMAGVIYFGVRGTRRTLAKRGRQSRGFPVLAQAAAAPDGSERSASPERGPALPPLTRAASGEGPRSRLTPPRG